jgi:membrane protein YdbS with pleckstrin-like domain
MSRPWLIGLMSLHFLLNVVAAVGIWFWKKWAMYVYAASTILAVVVGLLSIGIWSVFYMVLPFVILGWLLRTKWDYFK